MHLHPGAEINNKVKKLRATYIQTKGRLNHPMKSGSGGSTTSVKKWQFFDSLQFLDNYSDARKGTNNLSEV